MVTRSHKEVSVKGQRTPHPLYIAAGELAVNGLPTGFEVVFDTGLTDEEHSALEALLWSVDGVESITLGDREHTIYGVWLPSESTILVRQSLARLKELLQPQRRLTISASLVIPGNGDTHWSVLLVHDELGDEEKTNLLEGLREIEFVQEVRTESWYDRLVVAILHYGSEVTDPEWLEKHLTEFGAHVALQPEIMLATYAVHTLNLM